jgi:DNA polymerase-1
MAERACINSPIQGGAADVVMMAMLKLHADPRFRELGWSMQLQVHDELICEGPEASVEEALSIVKRCMEHPYPAPLRVDLAVDAKYARDWYSAK